MSRPEPLSPRKTRIVQILSLIITFLVASALALSGLGIMYAIGIGIVSGIVVPFLVFRYYDGAK